MRLVWPRGSNSNIAKRLKPFHKDLMQAHQSMLATGHHPAFKVACQSFLAAASVLRGDPHLRLCCPVAAVSNTQQGIAFSMCMF